MIPGAETPLAPRLVRTRSTVRRRPFDARCAWCSHCLGLNEVPIVVTRIERADAFEIACPRCDKKNYVRLPA